MTTLQKVYDISPVQQLIDLNGESVNFEINVKVSSFDKENKPNKFQVCIVDQTTLDSNELEFKEVNNGTMNISLTQDKNIYQNYFLALKASTPCKCVIEIQKTELPVMEIPPPQPPATHVRKSEGFLFSTRFWMLMIVIVVVGVVGYYFYKGSNSSKIVSNDVKIDLRSPRIRPFENFKIAPRPEIRAKSHEASSRKSSSHASASSSSSASSVSSKGNEITNRLKRLNLQ